MPTQPNGKTEKKVNNQELRDKHLFSKNRSIVIFSNSVLKDNNNKVFVPNHESI